MTVGLLEGGIRSRRDDAICPSLLRKKSMKFTPHPRPIRQVVKLSKGQNPALGEQNPRGCPQKALMGNLEPQSEQYPCYRGEAREREKMCAPWQWFLKVWAGIISIQYFNILWIIKWLV